MVKMKKYILLLVFSTCSLVLRGQNIVFSFDVTDNNDGTSSVNVYAECTSGTETMYAYTFALFHDNTLTTATGFTDAGLGWNFDGTFSAFNSNTTQAGYNGYMELQRIDSDVTGTAISDGDAPLLLATVTFTHISTPAGDGLIADSGILPAISYGSLSGDLEHPIVITGTAEQALPVDLKRFAVTKYGKDDAQLKWTSVSEVNSSHFEVERSSDNTAWEKLGEVKAAGNSSKELDYQYIDYNLPVNRDQTVFYYRLKMVDTNGEFNYSEVRKLSFNLPDAFVDIKVYPNPATHTVQVNTLSSLLNEEVESSILVFNPSGQLVLKRSISANGINNIDVSELPSSTYQMLINVGNETRIEKLVKID